MISTNYMILDTVQNNSTMMNDAKQHDGVYGPLCYYLN